MRNISVIVPVYNTMPYIKKCVDSILRQKEWIHEIILVDDGSNDGGAKCCDDYEMGYPELVKVIHQANGGAATARNKGIELATGDFLSFIDSDDYIEPDMYARLIEMQKAYDADMSVGSMWVEKLNGQRYCRVPQGFQFCWDTWEALTQLNAYQFLYTSFCNAIFKRTLFQQLRFPTVRSCEDYFLLHRVIARCKRVAYTSHPVYHYVQRNNSNSRNAHINLLPLEASKEQLAFFEKYFPELIYMAESDLAFASMSVYTNCIRNGAKISERILWQLRKTTQQHLRTVFRNQHIPTIKKMQAAAFCLTPKLYKRIIAKTEHR